MLFSFSLPLRMQKQHFQINTLHRAKYMLSFFSLLILAGILSSLLPAKEAFKIVFVLFTIPITLFLSVKFSSNSSTWTLTDEALTISFTDKTIAYPISDIDHIRSLTRSGGNLYVIYLKHKSPARYWRNKLFIADDDALEMHNALLEHEVEYYKL